MLHFWSARISFWIWIRRFCCVTKVLKPILKTLCICRFFIIFHIKNRLLKFGHGISICYLLHFNAICSFGVYFVVSYFSFWFVSLVNVCVFVGCAYKIFLNEIKFYSVFNNTYHFWNFFTNFDWLVISYQSWRGVCHLDFHVYLMWGCGRCQCCLFWTLYSRNLY